MPTMDDLAQQYIDAGLTPPARFVGNDTPVSEADVSNIANFIDSGGAATTQETAPTTTVTTSGGSTTEQDVINMFKSLGLSPYVNFDGSYESNRAARIAAEINSGERTLAEIEQIVSNWADQNPDRVVSGDSDPLALVPDEPQFANFRSMLILLEEEFPEQYAALVAEPTRVQGWVNEILGGGGRDADQIRDDIA